MEKFQAGWTPWASVTELLQGSDLSATRRRAVHDAIVSSTLDGAMPDRESVLRLIEYAAGRVNFEEHKRRILKARIGQHLS
ncbi:hypothetical protein [Mycobacteroides abscessus]|uniref:antitoxin VbhA family protein n=1 Tax=Mycobacteroides abscessus TaxID=36809 RepID=UPI00355AF2DB